MKIAFLGDIALFGRASLTQNPNGRGYFDEVERLLSEYDYVVGNLESPFSAKKKKWGAKSAFLCSDVENVKVLKYLHVDAVTLANNHMFDYGCEAFNLTIKLLEQNGIAWFGANGKEHLMEYDGSKLCFSGFCCYSTNPQGCVVHGDYGINEFDVRYVEQLINKYAEDGYLNICAVHAGIEHVNYPSLDTIAVAKKLSNKYPIIYYGHHPHVAQPVLMENASLIAYSLGNFCFDNVYANPTDKFPLVELSEDNRSSFILSVTVEHNKIENFEIVPIYIGIDRIHVGKGVNKHNLDMFLKNMLSMEPKEYENMRDRKRLDWVKMHKSKRDFMWFLRRLRPRYIRLMVTNWQNARKYIKEVKSAL